MYARAAQFAPFAALTGHSAAIKETARITDRMVTLGEYDQEMLNRKFVTLLEKISQNPVVSITYFEPDKKKEGGAYLQVEAAVKKYDEFNKVIILSNKKEIAVPYIIDIKGELFDNNDEAETIPKNNEY